MISTVPTSGSGAAINDRSFSPYGDVYQNTGFNDPLFFAGMNADLFATAGTGSPLYDTPNRELALNASRWLSPDPAGADWNAYSYPTDPNRETDPTGLDGQSPCAGWGSCELANDHISPLMDRFFTPDSTKYGTDGRPAPWLVSLSNHDGAKKKPRHKPHKPNKKNEVNKLYNEYSGIRPKPGATTESNRSQAVLNAAHVYDNVNGRGFQGSSGLGPQDARDIGKPGTDAAIYYQDAKDAVAQASNEPDPTGGATHAYIYDPAALNSGQLPVQAWVADGQTTTIEGPFINVSGGGDVPQGDEVYVITVKDVSPNQ